jgi:hypothetical protein
MNYYPIQGEFMLYWAARGYRWLYGSTPLMSCFELRYVSDYRRFYPAWSQWMTLAGLRLEDITSLRREKFLHEFLPLFKGKRNRPFWTGEFQLP